ncbi:bifunctional oligoribonuclease/PAP phosphatase NrnA [Spiroplasma endosymbiont of Crioceris asparagi]|uniref:DHH family phosphoesterase n=1 Tax=Spiroplasma endosymbiont of Crioceris asparagi TaxID=3066286 RepID=UPI0030D1ECF9
MNEIVKSIFKFETIIILRHVLPDGDAYGSQLGLKSLILDNFKHKKVYAFGKEISYLNFVGNMDVFQKQVFKNALVIVTDCGNIERIDIEDKQLLQQAKKVIKIDHHPDVEPYGDISWVDTSFTSASEMVGYLSLKNNWYVNKKCAQIIYHGICTDSGRFLYEGTTSRTFDVASYLFKTNFDFKKLYKNMYEKTWNDVLLNTRLINQAHITSKGVGYLIINKDIYKEFNIDPSTSGKFSNILSNIKEIKIWITFSWRTDNKWRVEFRSKDVSINNLAIKLGGGGHRLASGAIIENLNDIKKIIKEADSLL